MIVRELKYVLLPAVDPEGKGGTSKHGTVFELLIDCPYFFPISKIPSLAEINNFLASGIRDAGMSGGCRWKPFEITEEEYLELIDEIQTHPFKELIRTSNAKY